MMRHAAAIFLKKMLMFGRAARQLYQMKCSQFIKSRCFFSAPRIFKLEQEANEFHNRKDSVKQRALLKELFNSGNYKQCISRFENQPQLPFSEGRKEDLRYLQSDPLLLETYIAALIMDGKSNKVVEKISPFINAGVSVPFPSSSLSGTSSYSSPKNTFSPSSFRESEPIPHNMHTDRNKWQQEIDRTQPNSTFSTLNGGLPKQFTNSSDDGPIKVVLSEAWSWSKFARTFASRILYGVLLMTGLSVVLDQQGMLKQGIGSTEVEPLNSKTKVTFADVQGVDEAKQELEEVVAFLKEPSKFMELGGKLPKGILLYGPPGTGKTHLVSLLE